MGTLKLKIFLLLIPFCAQGQVNISVICFVATACTEPTVNAHILRTRIIESRSNNDILEIKIGTTETCCLKFEPAAKYYSGTGHAMDTLDLGYKTIGVPCDCECYHEFSYKIEGIMTSKFVVSFRGKPIELSAEKFNTYPVKFKIVNGDTVNRIDMYGLRQGIWTSDSLKLKKFYVFKDDLHIEEVVLFDNGNIQSIVKREFGNWNYLVEFFEGGQKKRECHNNEIGGSFREGQCKEWNESGDLTYDGPFPAEQKNFKKD